MLRCPGALCPQVEDPERGEALHPQKAERQGLPAMPQWGSLRIPSLRLVRALRAQGRLEARPEGG